MRWRQGNHFSIAGNSFQDNLPIFISSFLHTPTETTKLKTLLVWLSASVVSAVVSADDGIIINNKDILAGKQPDGLSKEKLVSKTLSPIWQEQQQELGFDVGQ